MKIQTDGFIVLGPVPNDERFRCLVCRDIPEYIHQNLYEPKANEIPAALSVPGSKTVVMLYRLCLRCHAAKPDPRKIRLLVLERFAGVANMREGQ